jgi:hypothetical protein
MEDSLPSQRPQNSQADKFKDAARKAGCDPDEKHWEDRLKKVAKAKPRPDPEASRPPR